MLLRNSDQLMYQSNRSLNIPPPPPPGNLSGIWIFGKFLFKFPPLQAKKLFKCPTIRSISSDQMAPPPGKLLDYLIIQHKESQVLLAHGWKKVGWDAFSCWTKSSKCFASNIMKSLRNNSGIFHISTSSQTSLMNSLLFMSSDQDHFYKLNSS